MGRYRNPRYAPEFLERKLSPSGVMAPAPMVFVTDAAPASSDTMDDGSDAGAADLGSDGPMLFASSDSSFDGGSDPGDGSDSGDDGSNDGSGDGSSDGSDDGD